MMQDIHIPKVIVLETQLELFDRTTDIKQTLKALKAGKNVLITAFYSNGLLLLKELEIHLKKQFTSNSFKEQREYRSQFQKLSNLILIEISGYKIVVKKAPVIGWLEKFYPDNSSFLLPFVQIQGLNSAWQWYQKGITLPVLRNKIHPYYGVYFPTRFDHLILFDNWLKRYEGTKKTAIEIGVGCGVLSFQMIKYGFQKVFATDTNPNAIVGLTEFMKETKLSRKLDITCASLFGKWEKQTELIVFNPPWLPQSIDLTKIDEAIYYDTNLFTDFFKEAKKRLLPDGKIVLLFSNLAKITETTLEHPIEKELKEGGRFRLEKCLTKAVKQSSDKTKRNQHWRSSEEVELWVLVHK